jgi:hypothetical protein
MQVEVYIAHSAIKPIRVLVIWAAQLLMQVDCFDEVRGVLYFEAVTPHNVCNPVVAPRESQ